MGVNLKFRKNLKLKEKVKGSDCDVSTVVLRVFLFRIFPFISFTSNSIVYRAILK